MPQLQQEVMNRADNLQAGVHTLWVPAISGTVLHCTDHYIPSFSRVSSKSWLRSWNMYATSVKSWTQLQSHTDMLQTGTNHFTHFENILLFKTDKYLIFFYIVYYTGCALSKCVLQISSCHWANIKTYTGTDRKWMFYAWILVPLQLYIGTTG